MKACVDCSFWDGPYRLSDAADKFGACRRHAPSPGKRDPEFDGATPDAFWPNTWGKEWCGDFEERA